MHPPTLRTLPVWLIVGLCIALVLMSSCGRGTVPSLPEGPQTVQGILKPAGLSIGRRGTHLLIREGGERFYVESSTVALRPFEGVDVILTGTFEYNIDPRDLPVLMVSTIVDEQRTLQPVRVPSLRLHLDVPEDWTMAETKGIVQFSASGGLHPILTIAKTERKTLPPGSPVLVDFKRGSRTVPAGSSDQIVYIETMSGILSFTLTPDTRNSLSAPALFLRILRTVRFDGTQSSKGSPQGSGSGALQDSPCGGAAGILCPTGYYCAIKDAGENIGICVQAR